MPTRAGSPPTSVTAPLTGSRSSDGIVEVVYHQHYSIDDVSMGLLHEAGVIVRPLEKEMKHE